MQPSSPIAFDSFGRTTSLRGGSRIWPLVADQSLPAAKAAGAVTEAWSLESLDAECEKAVALMLKWEFDPENPASGGSSGGSSRCSELALLVCKMFHSLGLLRACNLSPTAMYALVGAVQANMAEENPFHNFW